MLKILNLPVFIQSIFLDKFYIYLHNIQKDTIFPYNSNLIRQRIEEF